VTNPWLSALARLRSRCLERSNEFLDPFDP
jgi:hypothetical protein